MLNLHFDPKVYVVGGTTSDDSELARFMRDEGLEGEMPHQAVSAK
jgi:hypothetical protein